MELIRVFPRKTNACPDDKFVRFGPPQEIGYGQPVDVSCTFTYDKLKAEELAEQWAAAGYNVTLGGPAFGDQGGEFEPGLYLRNGITITSRGCNNNCWFCYVPKREGSIRELSIMPGWNVMDSNLLQCSGSHIKAVFRMLKQQKRKARFTGGLDSCLLSDWVVNELVKLKPERLYLAYDTPDDFWPLVVAADKLRDAGFKYYKVSCYILIGYPKDTMSDAEKRLLSVAKLGIMPFAMLWKNEKGDTNKEWRRFQRHWAAPVAVGAKMKQMGL